MTSTTEAAQQDKIEKKSIQDNRDANVQSGFAVLQAMIEDGLTAQLREILQESYQKPGVPLPKDQHHGTPLLNVVAARQMDGIQAHKQAQLLVDCKASIDEPDNYGFTPLMMSTITLNTGLLQWLLGRKANTTLVDKRNGKTALDWAKTMNGIARDGIIELLSRH